MSTSLCFNDFTFTPVIHQNNLWIRAAELASALGYAREDKVARLYQRNEEEFTEDMTQVIEIGTEPHFGTGRARIFSLRGCHLIAMFARTSVAKQFRRWVLDVLDKINQEKLAAPQSVTNCHQLPAAPLTPSTTADRAPLRSMVHAWATVSKTHHSALWPQVKAHFELTNIKDLPVEWIGDALAFVQAKIDSQQKALPAPTAPAISQRKKHTPGPIEREINTIADELDGGLDGMYSRFMQTMERLKRVTSPLYPPTFEALGWHSYIGYTIDPVSECLSDSYWQSIKHMENAFSDARHMVKQFRTLARLHGM